FLQTPPLASDALAIQIIFPLVRVIRHLSAYRVCQLRWANKKAQWQNHWAITVLVNLAIN
ncbi:hypothetical protein, partial [Pseudoalteromonas sp. 5Ae-yellow]|uniref:hypothetical protein n=1 Tax=Pseudoalteromonas sp. 5Ae-yellow TaxID=2759847 RepID=UPI0038F6E84F